MTTSPDYTWLTQGGAIGILAAGVLAFLRGWIVPGSEYRRVIAERDKAIAQQDKVNEIALRALDTASRKETP